MDFTFLTELTKMTGGLLGAFNSNSAQSNLYSKSADAYYQNAKTNKLVAEYNIELDRRQTARQLDAFTRDISRIHSTQLSQSAGSGFRTASKSSLAIMNDSLTNAARTVRQTKEANELLAEQRRFDANVQATANENRARALKYQAKQNNTVNNLSFIGNLSKGITSVTDYLNRD